MDEMKNDKQNSCEISINAKGQYSGKIKVYAETINEAMEQALIKSAELEKLINFKNEIQ